jgi:hypothetical protein
VYTSLYSSRTYAPRSRRGWLMYRGLCYTLVHHWQRWKHTGPSNLFCQGHWMPAQVWHFWMFFASQGCWYFALLIGIPCNAATDAVHHRLILGVALTLIVMLCNPELFLWSTTNTGLVVPRRSISMSPNITITASIAARLYMRHRSCKSIFHRIYLCYLYASGTCGTWHSQWSDIPSQLCGQKSPPKRLTSATRAYTGGSLLRLQKTDFISYSQLVLWWLFCAFFTAVLGLLQKLRWLICGSTKLVTS